MSRRAIGRAAAVLGGVLCALIVSEMALRAAGWAYARWRLPASVHSRSGQVRILCIGDSFTFGLGAPKGMSYPEQLQRLFDSSLPGKVTVVNGVVPGTNSTAVYHRLLRDFDRERPDIVVVMDGANDNNNFEESDYYRLLTGPSALLFRLDAELSNLRTYHLLRKAVETGLRESRERRISKTPDWRDPAARSTSAKRALEVVLELYAKSKPHEAYAAAREALKRDPDDPALRYWTGYLLLHRLDDPRGAAIELRRSDEIERDNTHTLDALFQACQRTGDADGMRAALLSLHRLEPENRMFDVLLRYGVPDIRNMDLFHRLIAFNLIRVDSFCRSRGALPVFQTYVDPNWPSETIAATAARSGAALIDNRRILSGLKDPRSYFAEDGHLNERGYRLMAQNAYRRLKPYVAERLVASREIPEAR